MAAQTYYADLTTAIEERRIQPEEVLRGERLKQFLSLLLSESAPKTKLRSVTKLISDLFRFDEVKKKNDLRTLVKALFACLNSNRLDSTVHQHIMTAIGNLANEQEPSNNWLVYELNALKVIFSAAKRFPSSPGVLARLCFALQKIACRNKDIIHVLLQEHMADTFADDLLTKFPCHELLQTQACALLRRLSFLEGTEVLMFNNSGLLVLKAMRSFPLNVDLFEHCCAIISNLAHDPENRKKFVLQPYCAHEAILTVMRNQSQNAVIQARACGALANILMNGDNKKMLTLAPHLVHEAALTAMRSHIQDAAVQEDGCRVLLNCAVDSEIAMILTGCDAHVAIAAALRSHPYNEDVQVEAVWALTNIANVNQNRPLLAKAEIFFLACQALQRFPGNQQLKKDVEMLENYFFVEPKNLT